MVSAYADAARLYDRHRASMAEAQQGLYVTALLTAGLVVNMHRNGTRTGHMHGSCVVHTPSRSSLALTMQHTAQR